MHRNNRGFYFQLNEHTSNNTRSNICKKKIQKALAGKFIFVINLFNYINCSSLNSLFQLTIYVYVTKKEHKKTIHVFYVCRLHLGATNNTNLMA